MFTARERASIMGWNLGEKVKLKMEEGWGRMGRGRLQGSGMWCRLRCRGGGGGREV